MRILRGQATVELALGSVVFVTVLLVGIHFAELGQLSLKVQEAETFAVWEAAHRRAQTREVDGTTRDQPFQMTLASGTGVAAQAQRRYRDFNGLSSVNKPPVVLAAMTRGSQLQVRCAAQPALTFAPSPTARAVYHDIGGLDCGASAVVEAVRIPRAFLQKEDNGFFEADPFRQVPMKVCGMGLPLNGTCVGRLSLLTNDWGLAGEDETESCDLWCRRSKYRGLVQRIFGGDAWTKGREFARTFAGNNAGTDATEFNFSYVGEEGNYSQFVGGEGAPRWHTGGPAVPGGMVHQVRTRSRCFLGRPGC